MIIPLIKLNDGFSFNQIKDMRQIKMNVGHRDLKTENRWCHRHPMSRIILSSESRSKHNVIRVPSSSSIQTTLISPVTFCQM